MSNILITGGAGFLGSHVADALSDAGHKVTLLDRVASQFKRDDQQMLILDVTDPAAMAEVIPQYDVIFHFAGMADIGACMENPVQAVRLNIEATVQMLEIVRRNPIKRFVYASTAYVFSESGGVYRATKQSAENFLHLYNKMFGLDYTILRFGSLYGTRSDEGNAIYRFVRQALREAKIDYPGTGEEVRQFIHVKDAAQACVQILQEEFRNQEILLTGPDKMHYKELFLMISEILGGSVTVNCKGEAGDANHYFITPYNFTPKPGKKLLVNPFTDMGQGLLELVEDMYKAQQS